MYVRVHIKIIPRKFSILNSTCFRVIYPKNFRNVSLQTYRNNRIGKKLAYFLRKIQILRKNNSRIFRIKNAKCSVYSFLVFITNREIFKSAFVYLYLAGESINQVSPAVLIFLTGISKIYYGALSP